MFARILRKHGIPPLHPCWDFLLVPLPSAPPSRFSKDCPQLAEGWDSTTLEAVALMCPEYLELSPFCNLAL
jgi:hypothetical protein